MERTKHPGIYRRGEGYVAIVSFKDGFGRRKHKWLPPEPTMAKAKDARRRALNQIEAGLKPDASRMTLEEFSGRWLADCERRRLRPLTIRGYRSLLIAHVIPALGHKRLRDVDGEALERLYNSLGSDAVRSRVHSALSAMFSYAVKDAHVLSVNPCQRIRRPVYRAGEARHLAPADAARLLAAVEGHELEPAVLLGLAGGLRIGEAVAVRWGDLDEDGTLTIRRSTWGETKSGRVRSLTLPAFAVAILRRHKRTQAEALLSVGVRQGPETTIVADPLGRPVNVETFRRSFRAFAAEHGFDVSFHSLRHSNAIALLLAGVDVRTAAGRLGHAKPGLLLATYSHYVREADKAAADRLERMLGG